MSFVPVITGKSQAKKGIIPSGEGVSDGNVIWLSASSAEMTYLNATLAFIVMFWQLRASTAAWLFSLLKKRRKKKERKQRALAL